MKRESKKKKRIRIEIERRSLVDDMLRACAVGMEAETSLAQKYEIANMLREAVIQEQKLSQQWVDEQANRYQTARFATATIVPGFIVFAASAAICAPLGLMTGVVGMMTATAAGFGTAAAGAAGARWDKNARDCKYEEYERLGQDWAQALSAYAGKAEAMQNDIVKNRITDLMAEDGAEALMRKCPNLQADFTRALLNEFQEKKKPLLLPKPPPPKGKQP